MASHLIDDHLSALAGRLYCPDSAARVPSLVMVRSFRRVALHPG
jgi:hypothetical protein